MEDKSRLDILRENFGLSKKDFASKINVSPPQLSQLLRPKEKLGNILQEKIINAFPDVNLNWLQTGEGNMFDSQTPNDSRTLQSKNIELQNKINIYQKELLVKESQIETIKDYVLKINNVLSSKKSATEDSSKAKVTKEKSEFPLIKTEREAVGRFTKSKNNLRH